MDRLGQPQRYCGNCGARLREGLAFCASCGSKLIPETTGSNTDGNAAERVETSTPSASGGSRASYGQEFERLRRRLRSRATHASEAISDKLFQGRERVANDGTDFGAGETSTIEDAPQPRKFPLSLLDGATRWFKALQLPQKILLVMLIASVTYMLVFHTGLFLALVLLCGLLTAGAFFGLRERFRWVAASVQRHQGVSGVVLLVLVCSTPLLMPAVGTFLLLLFNIAIVILIAAGFIGLGVLVIKAIADSAERHREQQEAHRRWYNSLSESQKQTYNLERQTRMQEAQLRMKQAEQISKAIRQSDKRYYR